MNQFDVIFTDDERASIQSTVAPVIAFVTQWLRTCDDAAIRERQMRGLLEYLRLPAELQETGETMVTLAIVRDTLRVDSKASRHFDVMWSPVRQVWRRHREDIFVALRR